MLQASIAPAYSAPTAHRRLHARARLRLPARLTTFSGTAPCTLIDVSCTGARIGVAECPRIGAMVVIEGCPIELFGTVRWCGDRLFGFEFDVPLPEAQVIAMRRFSDGQPEREKIARLAYAQEWVQGTTE